MELQHMRKREKVVLLLALVVILFFGGFAGAWIRGRSLDSQLKVIREAQNKEVAELQRKTSDQAIQMQQHFESTKGDAASQKELQTRAVSELETIKTDLQAKLVHVEKERDTARDELNTVRGNLEMTRSKLAPFEQRAAQLYTNEPAADALNKLYKNTQPPDSFEVSINGLTVANREPKVSIKLTKENALTISVKNTGRFPLKDVNVLCSADWLVDSNVVSSAGWERPGLRKMKFPDGEKLAVLWRTRVNVLTAAGDNYVTPPIILKTNLAGRRTLPISLQIFSERSDTRDFWVNLNYDPQ